MRRARVDEARMRPWALVLAAALTVPAVAVPAVAAPAAADLLPSKEQRYVVQFTSGTTTADGAREVRARGGHVERGLEHVFAGAIARLSPSAAAALERHPRIQKVELDVPVTASDTQAAPPWGLDRVDQVSLPLSGSYDWTAGGAGVSAYVVDSGIRADHVDFSGRVEAGVNVISDGEGVNDCNGHGTHVAATIGGSRYGVAKAVRLIPVRVLGCDGSGTLSGVVTGLDWVVRHHLPGVPAVANVSLGGGASTTLDAAIQAAVDDGITVAVAAGNSNVDACTGSPARVPAALTVGATNNLDARASFSNHGVCLDLFAPGVAVLSAWPSSATDSRSVSGTSMASPHVAGAAAALLEADPTLSPAAVAGRLTSTASTGLVTAAGAGSPNKVLWADPALAPPPPTASLPSAPTTLTALAGNGSAQVFWTAAEPNGSPVLGYTVTSAPGGLTCTTSENTSCTVSGLANGTSYTFTALATNGVGNGPASAPSNSVNPTAPDTTAPSVTVTAGPAPTTHFTAASFSFTGSDPGRPGAALTYRCRLDSEPDTPCTSPTSYTSLSDGLRAFRVVARDETGNISEVSTITWRVDATAPIVTPRKTPIFTLSATVGLTYSGTDGAGSGLISYDVRHRSAAYNGTYGSYVYPDGSTRDWTDITATSVTLPASAGYTYCLSARARDMVGNVSKWSADQCTAVALDDRALSASSGWNRVTSSSYYKSTATTTWNSGAVLTRTGVQGRHLALVATTCPNCGTVGVYWNGTILTQISLVSSTTVHKNIIPVADLGSTQTGTLTVKNLKSGRTTIDGAAIRRG